MQGALVKKEGATQRMIPNSQAERTFLADKLEEPTSCNQDFRDFSDVFWHLLFLLNLLLLRACTHKKMA